MKFYIAGRTSRISEIKSMVTKLKDLGHEVTHDWTEMENADLPRPYNEHLELVRDFALKDIDGAKEADVFVILGDQSGTGMYVEFGAALAMGAKIYAVGEYNDITVFHFHPSVVRVATFEDVLNDLNR